MHLIKQLSALALVMMSFSSVRAGEANAYEGVIEQADSHTGDWHFGISTYAHVAAIEGDIAVGGFTASFEKEFEEILEDLDSGIALAAEVRYKRWKLQLDYISVSLRAQDDLGIPFYHSADVGVGFDLFTCISSYRLWDTKNGYFEVGAGARLFHVDVDLTLQSSSILFPTIELGLDENFWDGLAVVRYSHRLNEKWDVTVYGDVGAGDSDLTWQSFVNFGYALNDNWKLNLGYRHVSYAIEKEPAELDLSFSGPQIGILYQF